ncbi:unnamed protein product [Ilex paraguariensis]|uniref:BIRD-IDD transcription factor fourth C2HC zinc finger domain-containing protein n=1 Tax=Ilex paraguariensis TaxID=185542 RepID=A0ABC8UAK2_9AQUA
MSNFIQEFEEEDEQFHSTAVTQSSHGSPNPNGNGGDGSSSHNTTTSKTKRNLPGNPGKIPERSEPSTPQERPQFAMKAEAKAKHTRSTETRNGSATSAQSVMLFSSTGRKDSFVTHRAFYDALTKENYNMNQTLAVTGGMLQNHAHELFSSSIPTSDSYTNTNAMIDISISHHENIDNSANPPSVNSHGIMMSSNLDPIFNPGGDRASFGSVGGHNNSTLTVVSAYTSATALLQKAVEMGAKISSDNSIARILLRGFAGYPTSSVNSSASELQQEAFSLAGSVLTSTNALYAGIPETSHNNVEEGNQSSGHNFSQTGLYDSSFCMTNSYGYSNSNLLEKEVIIGGSEKMTLEFLGEGASRSYQWLEERKL